jgi:uncharacterized protein involved in type VI secretion and phage assembly
VAVGVVREIDAASGRVRVELPWLNPAQTSNWAPIATLMSGRRRGAYFMPEIDDEVLLAFEHGDLAHPFVVGFLWNGVDSPPAGERRMRVIH